MPAKYADELRTRYRGFAASLTEWMQLDAAGCSWMQLDEWGAWSIGGRWSRPSRVGVDYLEIDEVCRRCVRSLLASAAAMPFSPWVDMEAIKGNNALFAGKEAIQALAGIDQGEGGSPRHPLASRLHGDEAIRRLTRPR